MGKTKLHTVICSEMINISSDDTKEYLVELSNTVNKQINTWYGSHKNCNFKQAIIMTALQFCDERNKNSLEIEKLEYKNLELEIEKENLNKNIELIKASLEALKSKNSELERKMTKLENEKLQLENKNKVNQPTEKNVNKRN